MKIGKAFKVIPILVLCLFSAMLLSCGALQGHQSTLSEKQEPISLSEEISEKASETVSEKASETVSEEASETVSEEASESEIELDSNETPIIPWLV